MPKWKPGQSGNPGGRKKLVWKDELEKAIIKRGDKLHESPFLRLAKLFYTDDNCAVGILNYIIPKLKSIDAKIEQDSPFRLIIDCTPTKAETKDKAKQEKPSKAEEDEERKNDT